MAIVSDAWDVVVLFAPLLYVVILGPCDRPTRRVIALIASVVDLLMAIEAMAADATTVTGTRANWYTGHPMT